jgi:hypothetical protein
VLSHGWQRVKRPGCLGMQSRQRPRLQRSMSQLMTVMPT